MSTASAILTRDQSRTIDQRAIEQYGISGLVLMENAGRGCADVLERLGIEGPVAIFCGKGNNAGDGFVLARHLEIRGYACRVLLAGDPNELRGDAAANFAILQKTRLEIVNLLEVSAASRAAHGPPRLGGLTDSGSLHEQLEQHAGDAAWLVDALLGTGAQGEPRPPMDAIIDWINARDAKTRALAVDIPSGLDCDTGQPASHTVHADHTCTFATMKIGFTQPTARPFTGEVHVGDIGVPPRLIEEILQMAS